MELDIKYRKGNAIRYDHNDKCWVRELFLNGVWFLFYSPEKERLSNEKLNPDLSNIVNGGFPELLRKNTSCLPEEFRNYIHVTWPGCQPQTGFFVNGLPVNWKSALILQDSSDPQPGPPPHTS